MMANDRTLARSGSAGAEDDLQQRRQALAAKLAAEEEQLRGMFQAPQTASLAARRQEMLKEARQRAAARDELRAQVCSSPCRVLLAFVATCVPAQQQYPARQSAHCAYSTADKRM